VFIGGANGLDTVHIEKSHAGLTEVWKTGRLRIVPFEAAGILLKPAIVTVRIQRHWPLVPLQQWGIDCPGLTSATYQACCKCPLGVAGSMDGRNTF
jgi:hypothetical protein